MGDIDSVQMDDQERDEFLSSGGTGVISFSTETDEAPHSIPVSYGYDASNVRFYFRLAFGPDSEKVNVIDRPISFVTYDHTDRGWRSVVVSGRLESVTEAEIDSDVIDGMRRIDVPIVDVFDRTTREVSFSFFHLAPEEVTSRKETATD